MPPSAILGSLDCFGAFGSGRPRISTEIELKLAARAADLPALRRALRQMAGGQKTERRKLVQSAERLAIGTDVALLPLLYSTGYSVFDAKRWAGLPVGFFGVDYASIYLK